MSSVDPLATILGGLDRPVQPRPEFAETLLSRLFDELGEAQAPAPKPRRLHLGLPRTLPSTPLRLRLVLIVLVLFLLLATWAALTLAFGWHVVFGRAQRAQHTSRIFKEFDSLDLGAPSGMATGVVSNQTRLVARFGRYRLWVAPTKAGGSCSAMVGGPFGSGGCDRLGTIPLRTDYSTYSGPSQGLDRSHSSPGNLAADAAHLRSIGGSVDPRWSESVEIRFRDGTVIRPRIVWVSAPIAEGFFFQAIARDQRRPGHTLREVDALDAEGNIVVSDLSALQLRRMYSNDPPAEAMVDHAVRVAQTDTPLGEASLWQAPSRFGTTCTWIELAGRFYFAVSNALQNCQIEGYSSKWRAELVRSGSVVLFYAAGIPSSGSVRLESRAATTSACVPTATASFSTGSPSRRS
jgi:hypothetical protein